MNYPPNQDFRDIAKILSLLLPDNINLVHVVLCVVLLLGLIGATWLAMIPISSLLDKGKGKAVLVPDEDNPNRKPATEEDDRLRIVLVKQYAANRRSSRPLHLYSDE